MSSVKERPIVFAAPMVRSILEGQKTVTRSPIKDQPPTGHKWRGWVVDSTNSKIVGKASFDEGGGPLSHKPVYARCPYGKPGDRLWVRETFATLSPGDYEPVKPARGYGQDIRYSATDPLAGLCADTRGYKWRASVQMPRWASRILLEVTGIRVERLRSTEDIELLADLGDMLEDCDSVAGKEFSRIEHLQSAGAPLRMIPEMYGFKAFWDDRNGAGSFDANPWVWVVEFKRVKP